MLALQNDRQILNFVKDIYVAGKKRPEMIAKVPNAKVVLFISNQSLIRTIKWYCNSSSHPDDNSEDFNNQITVIQIDAGQQKSSSSNESETPRWDLFPFPIFEKIWEI